MKAWMDTGITALLRTGVLLSVGIIAVGMVIALAHHPDEFFSPAALGRLASSGTHFPDTMSEVLAGVRRGSGQAIIMAGLLVLIATPVARVALSIVIFVIEGDRLYASITTGVFIILMIAFAIGRAAG